MLDDCLISLDSSDTPPISCAISPKSMGEKRSKTRSQPLSAGIPDKKGLFFALETPSFHETPNNQPFVRQVLAPGGPNLLI